MSHPAPSILDAPDSHGTTTPSAERLRKQIHVSVHARIRASERGLSGCLAAFCLDALRAGRYSKTRPEWTSQRRGRVFDNRSQHEAGDVYVWDETERHALVLNGSNGRIVVKTILVCRDLMKLAA